MPSRASVTWRYLPGREIRHAIEIEDAGDGYARALCGLGPQRLPKWLGWFGTGSQAEYEHVETLRECERCARSVTEVV